MPSERAAAASRLFQRERWREAASALAAVAQGDASDDEGNRQIAQYHLAIALYRLGEYSHAAEIFQDIALHRNHLKFSETLLWIGKVADHAPSVIRALRFYEPGSVGMFSNPQQLELFWKMAFLMGRERFERGDLASAARLFGRVDPQSPYHELARACLARLPSAPGEIVLHNRSAGPIEIREVLGPSMDMALIDEEGRLAPIKLFAPPHRCERACDAPSAQDCGGGPEPRKVEPGASHRLPWDGTIRKLRSKEGRPCFERAPAPAGVYLLRACSNDGRCGVARFSVPVAAPIEIALGEREPGDAPACEAGALRRALGITLGQARLAGLSEEQLAGCSSLAPGCGGPELDGEPGACRARITADPGRFEVELRPPARDGAPLRFAVWVDAQAVSSGNVFREGSRWAASPDGSLLVRGEPGRSIHEHGGEASRISSARLKAYNQGDRPRKLSLRGALWLTNYQRTTLEGASLVDDKGAKLLEAIVPPRSSLSLGLWFPVQHAYQSWNDRFTVEAVLDAEGAELRPASEIHVSRIDVVRSLEGR